jgi:hypothetical protein
MPKELQKLLAKHQAELAAFRKKMAKVRQNINRPSEPRAKPRRNKK